MPSDAPPLIAATARPSLEQALRAKLARQAERAGSMGELEPLALRLGLIQNQLRPRLRQPQLLLFAGDHGLEVDLSPQGRRPSADLVADVLDARVLLPLFAHQQGLTLSVVDCGLATPMPVRPGLLSRKIAHGTRNARVAQAMTVAQAQAAIRAGTEIAESLPGNVLGCAALGLGADEAAALVIARLSGLTMQQLLPGPPTPTQTQRLQRLNAALLRHQAIDDPVEVLAALGGFETAVMVGAMLRAAEKRHLILVDGLAACAALIVASHIAGPVSDCCVFCRSNDDTGLDAVLAGFHSTALLHLGLNTLDGTGAALSWPLIAAAAALLNEADEAREADASEPADSEITPLGALG